MVQKLGLTLGLLALALGVGVQAQTAENRAAVSGYVRNTAGLPQMGAAVEVLGSAVNRLKVFTDERGFYSAGDLKPGVYSIKVSAASFLPALREKVDLRASASAVVNVTLNTLFEAIQWGPVRAPSENNDDWKWVLRTSANRPILRALPDGSEVVASEGSDHDLKGTPLRGCFHGQDRPKSRCQLCGQLNVHLLHPPSHYCRWRRGNARDPAPPTATGRLRQRITRRSPQASRAA